jgi:isoquinoline 1-oxidoreductase subunit beta
LYQWKEFTQPLFPPVFAAVANAMFQATGERSYDQPFLKG